MTTSVPDPAAVSLLDKARASRDDLEARLLLAAAVSRIAGTIGVPVVVTGGTAVDFYVAGAAGTSAGYPVKWQGSADGDVVVLVMAGPVDAEGALRRELEVQLGFQPQRLPRPDGTTVAGRAIVVPDFRFGLEVVGDELRGDPRGEYVMTVDVDGQLVALRGPEDTIISYAESGWDTHHAREWERALAVYRAMREVLDLSRLEARAQERRMPGVLRAVMAQRPLPPERTALF